MRSHVRHLADRGGDRDQPPRDVLLAPGPGPGGKTQPRLTPPPSLRSGKARAEVKPWSVLSLETVSDRVGGGG